MALSKIQSESINLADDYAFTGTVSGAGGGKILQVQSANKTDTQTVANLVFQNVTDLSVTVTPASTSSKFLIVGTIHIGSTTSGDFAYVRLQRDVSGGSATNLVADADGARVQCTTSFDYSANNASGLTPANFHYTDSPSTTSSITYKLQLRSGSGANNVYVNRTHSDRALTNYDQRTVSNITVYEYT
jgi:hypothetical protein